MCKQSACYISLTHSSPPIGARTSAPPVGGTWASGIPSDRRTGSQKLTGCNRIPIPASRMRVASRIFRPHLIRSYENKEKFAKHTFVSTFKLNFSCHPLHTVSQALGPTISDHQGSARHLQHLSDPQMCHYKLRL